MPPDLVTTLTTAEERYVAGFARTHANHGEPARRFDEALAAWYAACAWTWLGDDDRASDAHERATRALASVEDPDSLPRSGEVVELIPALRGMTGLRAPAGTGDLAAWERSLDEALVGAKRGNQESLAFLRLRLRAIHDPGGEVVADFRRAFPQLEHVVVPKMRPLASI